MIDENKFEPENLRALLEQRAKRRGDEIFLFSEADGRRWTYAEFNRAVNRAARFLLSLEIKKGDVVSLLLPNSAEYIIAYFACFAMGAIAGPINSLLKAEEMKYVLENSEAKAIIFHPDFADEVTTIRPDLPKLKHVIEYADEAKAGGEFSSDNLPEIPLSKETEAIIIYTSGTTGKPKGCLLTHGNLIANARQISNWMRFDEQDRLLTMMPLFHMNAVSVTTMTALYAGGSTVVSPKFSASRFWKIISDYGITSFGSVATMLSMLLQTYPNGVPEELSTEKLRFAMCGSAPVPVEVLNNFEKTFNCLVIEGYGLSESTCRSTFNPPDERRRPGSCGMAIGNEMKIFDEEDREVPDGELGEIVLHGENIFKGYYKNEEATRRAFRNGWFHTGDVGRRDADGFFYIVDRKSDMIIRAGENIYPREIDETLYRHPKISAAATIGVPDKLYGEEVAAFVVLKAGETATEEEIITFCRAHLADYKCPKQVRFVADIPKGPTGKQLKRELKSALNNSSDQTTIEKT
jgi:acyl-CoA synthetase (AMP-forming)/AMP-acid ligase II